MSSAERAGGRLAATPPRQATWLEASVALVAFALVAAWWLWPLPLRGADHALVPRSVMPEVAADWSLITWALAWDTHALLTRPLALFHANIFHPTAWSLAYSEHFLGYVPLFAPTYLATGNAVLSSNVLLFATFPLSATAMYLLARRFVSSPAALLAGFFFAFCGLRYHSLYHFHQLGVFYLPLVLLLTELWLERARISHAVLLAVAIALQMLSSFYLAYALVLLYGAYLAVALPAWRKTLDRRRLLGLLLVVAVGSAPALAASLPYLELQGLGLIPSYAEGDGVFTLDPGITMRQVGRYLTRDGIGIVGYALAAVALLFAWRSNAYAIALGLVAGMLGVVLATGPRLRLFGVETWSPYALLADWVPGFGAIRLPFRFLIVSQLGVALLAAVGFDQLKRRLSPRLAWAGAAAALALALVSAPSLPPHQLMKVPVGDELRPLYRWLRANGEGAPLLELPLEGVAESGRRTYASIHHRLPMVDGYSAYPPPTHSFFRRLGARLPDAAALQELIDLVDIAWLAVHLDRLPEPARTAWQAPAVPGLRPVGRWGEDLLFRVELAPANDRRARFVDTERTPGGVPLEDLGERCPGVIHATWLGATSRPQPSTGVVLGVELRNRGREPWPGFGLYPRHLVRLRVDFERRGVRVSPPTYARLPADVPPGRGVRVGVQLVTPAWAGPYDVVVTALQGSRSLERCGVAPLRVPLEVAATSAPH